MMSAFLLLKCENVAGFLLQYGSVVTGWDLGADLDRGDGHGAKLDAVVDGMHVPQRQLGRIILILTLHIQFPPSGKSP